MSLSDLIAIDPEIVGGKPVIRGTRLAVEFILELLAAGQSESDLIANYPGLTREDILACLSYASCLAKMVIYLVENRLLSLEYPSPQAS